MTSTWQRHTSPPPCSRLPSDGCPTSSRRTRSSRPRQSPWSPRSAAARSSMRMRPASSSPARARRARGTTRGRASASIRRRMRPATPSRRPVFVEMGTRSRSRSMWEDRCRIPLARRHPPRPTELEAGRAARFEAEAKYRALVEHIPAVVYLDPVDEDSESIYVSPQVVELLGISQDEWLNNPYAWRHHVHPEDIDRAWDEYQHAYGAHEPLNHEYRMIHEDGTVRWVLEQAYPIDDEHGEPWSIQGDLRHHRAQARRGAGRVPRVPRQADRSPNRALFEEMLDAATARALDGTTWGGGPVPRPRQLQARERLPVTMPVTSSCSSSPIGSAGARGRPTSWRGRVATSSSCCWRTSIAASVSSPGPRRRRWSRSRWRRGRTRPSRSRSTSAASSSSRRLRSA